MIAVFQSVISGIRKQSGIDASVDRYGRHRYASRHLYGGKKRVNAVKYGAPEGEITAEVRQEGRQAVLTVTNPVTEPLTRDQLSQMFNRFYRADPSRSKDRREGFGIGLAIAAAIAEKHGGTIEARMAGDTALAMVCRLNR